MQDRYIIKDLSKYRQNSFNSKKIRTNENVGKTFKWKLQ